MLKINQLLNFVKFLGTSWDHNLMTEARRICNKQLMFMWHEIVIAPRVHVTWEI